MKVQVRSLFPLLGLSLATCVWDVNGDGTIVVACLGDSNTAAFFGDPYGGYGDWCEELSRRHPDIRFLNYAVSGARAVGGAHDGQAQIDRAAAGELGPSADFVILAFLTNDIGYAAQISPEEAAGRIGTLVDAAESHGMRTFVATVPPIFDWHAPANMHCTPNVTASPVIAATNALLRSRTDPLWLIDFDTGFECLTDYYPGDGVHVKAQQKRADRAAEALLSVPE